MYSSYNPAEDIDGFLKRHAPLVKRIAYHLAGRLPASVMVDDLIQAGMVGLLEASRMYDPKQGASFETYAGIRVRGAMLDELRRNDWAPKSVHKKARDLMEAMRAVENQTGRDAKDEEVAAHLGISLDEYYKILQDSSVSKVFSLDDLGVDNGAIEEGLSDKQLGPLEMLQAADKQRIVAQAIDRLPQREKLVVVLYYQTELNLREIGAVLDVSESRVSQLMTQALMRLKARLESRLEP
ncbi:MAG: RNA polymerase sigma factor FliA [Pseudomonadota bacterium]